MRVPRDPNKPTPPIDPKQKKRNQLIMLGIAVFILLTFLVSECNSRQTANDLGEGMSDTMREYCALVRQQGGTDKDCK